MNAAMKVKSDKFSRISSNNLWRETKLTILTDLDVDVREHNTSECEEE